MKKTPCIAAALSLIMAAASPAAISTFNDGDSNADVRAIINACALQTNTNTTNIAALNELNTSFTAVSNKVDSLYSVMGVTGNDLELNPEGSLTMVVSDGNRLELSESEIDLNGLDIAGADSINGGDGGSILFMSDGVEIDGDSIKPRAQVVFDTADLAEEGEVAITTSFGPLVLGSAEDAVVIDGGLDMNGGSITSVDSMDGGTVLDGSIDLVGGVTLRGLVSSSDNETRLSVKTKDVMVYAINDFHVDADQIYLNSSSGITSYGDFVVNGSIDVDLDANINGDATVGGSITTEQLNIGTAAEWQTSDSAGSLVFQSDTGSIVEFATNGTISVNGSILGTDSALPLDGSDAMQGDLDMGGYDIISAGSVSGDIHETTDTRSMNNNTTRVMYTNPYSIPQGITSQSSDVIACDGSTGYYAAPSDITFETSEISTNNYILITDPDAILGDTRVVKSVLSAGVCAVADTPVAGMVVGDQYVTFDHDAVITRTNSVTSAKLGVKVLEFSPSIAYLSACQVRASVIYNTTAGAYESYFCYASARWIDLTEASVITQGVLFGQTYDEDVSSEMLITRQSLYFFNTAFGGATTTTRDISLGRLQMSIDVHCRYNSFIVQ
jgi:hypothetical protein